MTAVRPLVSVVDDGESVRESLPDLLNELGYSARTFSSAPEFLRSDALDETAILLLDIAMPGMTGIELQTELKRRGNRVPIAFITASRDETIRSRVVGQGAAACLIKPFSDTDLLEGLQSALRIEWEYSSPMGKTMSARGAGRELTISSMTHATPVVFVVDDDVSVRESLELLIHHEGWQVRTFASASEFLACPRPSVPNCLILDISMPELSGLKLQKRIARERTEMPIIFITGYGDVPTTQAMKSGAVEFLTKPFTDEALVGAIRQAIERSREALHREREMQALRGEYASLSQREREVMALVVTGKLSKEVAGELGISEITVKVHRGRVMQKMKADSLADLVNMAAKLGLGRGGAD